MLIYNEQLQELAKYKSTTGSPMISLYINVTPPYDDTMQLHSMIHSARNECREKMDPGAVDDLERLFSQIDKYARNHLKGLKNTRLVVIFADSSGLWQEYHLPVSLPGQMVVEPKPYIRPLTALMDEFKRYLVLIADSRHARLFSLYLGDFEEQPDVFMESDVPDRVRVNASMAETGGQAAGKVYGGLGDKRIESHIKDQIHKHLKYAADKTFDYFRKKNFTRFLIGTPDDKNRPWLKGHLHSYLKERLAGEFNANPTLPDSELKKAAMEAASQYERENERRIIDALFEKSISGNMAVLGIDPVIRALRKGQVHTLVIENGYKTKGYICHDDHVLSSMEENCPLCGASMTEVGDLLDEMAGEAILHNSEIMHIFTAHEEFQKYHAGALLRFSMQ